jgi:hypothetical protein
MNWATDQTLIGFLFAQYQSADANLQYQLALDDDCCATGLISATRNKVLILGHSLEQYRV